MKDLDGLIARVEQATGADREIDAMLHVIIAERREWKVDGYVFYAKRTEAPHDVYRVGSIDPGITARNFSPSTPFPPYSSSIDAALGLMERVLGKAVMRRVYDDPDGYGVNCDIVLDNGDSIKVRGALTWPLAIILATLQALQSLPEGDVR